jgi:hypothetical protein
MDDKLEEIGIAANLRTLVHRTNLDNPSRQDVAALRKLLRDNPQLWKQVGDPARKAVSILVENSSLSTATKEASRVGVADLVTRFNYDDSPPLEKLLIDQIVIRWLHLAVVDYEFSLEAHKPKPPDQCMMWEKRLSMTQRRFVQACESLIRIRAATRSIPGGLFHLAPQPDATGNGDSIAHSSASRGTAPALRGSDWSIHFQEDSAPAASAATP